jgi:hypothetical protein
MSHDPAVDTVMQSAADLLMGTRGEPPELAAKSAA